MNDPENKITQIITIGETTVKSKLLTKEYRSFLAADSSEKNEQDDFWYFKVVFENKQTDKLDEKKILYLNFDMQGDFSLKTSQGLQTADICQRIENGRKGSYEYLVAFQKDQQADRGNMTVFYEDKIFGIGKIAFVYKRDDIEKIPAPKL